MHWCYKRCPFMFHSKWVILKLRFSRIKCHCLLREYIVLNPDLNPDLNPGCLQFSVLFTRDLVLSVMLDLAEIACTTEDQEQEKQHAQGSEKIVDHKPLVHSDRE